MRRGFPLRRQASRQSRYRPVRPQRVDSTRRIAGQIFVELDVAAREFERLEHLPCAHFLIARLVVASQQGLMRSASFGCSSRASFNCSAALSNFPCPRYACPRALRPKRAVQFRLGDFLVELADVGVEIGRLVEHVAQRVVRSVRWPTFVPQQTIALQAASTASAVLCRAAKASARWR